MVRSGGGIEWLILKYIYNTKIYVKLKMLTLNFKKYEDQLFYIVTFMYWHIVYTESWLSMKKKNKLTQKKKKKNHSFYSHLFIQLIDWLLLNV